MAQSHLHDWADVELDAAHLVANITQLYSRQHVELVASGRTLIAVSPFSLIRLLQREARLKDVEFRAADALIIVQALLDASLHPCRIDLSVLISQWVMLGRPRDLHGFFMGTLGRRFLTNHPRLQPSIDVILMGFGRVARMLTRIITRYGPGCPLRLGTVITRGAEKQELERRAHLLINDSVHGPFDGIVETDHQEHGIIVNGTTIRFVDTSGPVPEPSRDTVLIDSTGSLSKNVISWLDAPASTAHNSLALLTYPSPGQPTLIFGENQFRVHELGRRLFSTGSHEANAVIPVLRMLRKEFAVQDAHIQVVHPYTNDQNLLDNLHDTPRLGRAAPQNLVLLESYLALEITEVMPDVNVTTSSLRAPVPVGSLASISFQADHCPSVQSLNAYLKDEAVRGEFRSQIEYSDAADLVSSDIIGNPHSAVLDSTRTLSNGRHAVVNLWYDNEYGYACQVVRMLQEIGDLSVMQYG